MRVLTLLSYLKLLLGNLTSLILLHLLRQLHTFFTRRQLLRLHQLPDFAISRLQNSNTSKLKTSDIQNFRASELQNFRTSELLELENFKTSRLQNFRTSELYLRLGK
jgi:hypothetical protein